MFLLFPGISEPWQIWPSQSLGPGQGDGWGVKTASFDPTCYSDGATPTATQAHGILQESGVSSQTQETRQTSSQGFQGSAYHCLRETLAWWENWDEQIWPKHHDRVCFSGWTRGARQACVLLGWCTCGLDPPADGCDRTRGLSLVDCV